MEDEIRRLTKENRDLTIRIFERKSQISTVSKSTDDEDLMIVKHKKKLKKAKTGINKVFAHDDDSYIEIILPYSFF